MDVGAVVELVRQIAGVRAQASPERSAVESGLRAEAQVRAWLAASNADLTRALAGLVSFPEQAIAECTRGSLHDGVKARERSDTLASVPSFASALDSATVTAGHVDAITKATKGLDNDDQRAELFDRVAALVDVAAVATVREFGRRLDREVKAIRRDDGMARLERQRRAVRMRSWTDGEGMVCFSGRFDPITGVRIVSRLDAEIEALFAEAVPDTCPTDPVEKQHHLTGLAFARLATGESVAGRPGRPEYVVVVDSSQPDGAGGPAVDWGLPVEVPGRVLGEMMADGEVHTVVVRNGVVLHAPGSLDLGHTTRLANRAQRRALRALYATCAIPGCAVRYERCKLHHVVWWRHGGRTDLDNLLPVCARHHSTIHHDGWVITLGADRELTIRFPDGTVRNTGPPSRRAA